MNSSLMGPTLDPRHLSSCSQQNQAFSRDRESVSKLRISTRTARAPSSHQASCNFSRLAVTSRSRGKVTFQPHSGIRVKQSVHANPGSVVAQAKASKRGGGNGVALSSDSEDEGDDPVLRQKRAKRRALEAAMTDITNTYGKGSVTFLDSKVQTAIVETFPTGILTLDVVLGGGYPQGRIIELFGPESSGKTTLAIHAIAEIQRKGGNAALIDAEHAFDRAYASKLGVNVSELLICQPDCGEMALEVVDRLLRSDAMDLIVVDSVSALAPRAEIEGDIGAPQMGLQARLMSSSLRKLTPNAARSGCTVIFLNQIRHKIGIVFGNPETTSGGTALNYYASVRMDIRASQRIKSGDKEIGIHARVKVVKSKVSVPYGIAEFDILFNEGVNRLGCIADAADAMGFLTKKGAWYSYGEQRIGQGRDKVLQFLRDNPQICEELDQKVRAQITASSNEGAPDMNSSENGHSDFDGLEDFPLDDDFDLDQIQ